MNEETMTNWEKAKQARMDAERWQDLPNGPKYQNDTMSISIAHCKPPKLCRAGQQSCGGNNYWETEDEFNKAILEYLVGNWKSIYPSVLEILKKKESEALKKCQNFVTKMQQAIDQTSK